MSRLTLLASHGRSNKEHLPSLRPRRMFQSPAKSFGFLGACASTHSKGSRTVRWHRGHSSAHDPQRRCGAGEEGGGPHGAAAVGAGSLGGRAVIRDPKETPQSSHTEDSAAFLHTSNKPGVYRSTKNVKYLGTASGKKELATPPQGKPWGCR